MKPYIITDGVKRKVSRWIALFTCAAFLQTTFLPPAQAASPQPVESVRLRLPADFSSIQIPSAIGKIDETFTGDSDFKVIVVQDAHGIPDAQRSIRKTILYFHKQYGINFVALEGAAAKLDARMLKSFPDKARLSKVLGEYFDQGELSGGTAAAISGIKAEDNSAAGTRMIFHGMEDWSVYEEALGLYLAAMGKEKGILEELEVGSSKLEEGKGKEYSAELRKIDTALKKFRTNSSDFLKTLEVLAEVKAPSEGSELALLLEQGKKETQDTRGLELTAEVLGLAAKADHFFLTASPSDKIKSLQREFQGKKQEFQTSQITPELFALSLKKIASQAGIQLEVSEQLLGLVQKEKRMASIEGTRLFAEFELYAQTVKESLFKTEQDRELDQRDRRLWLAFKLAKLEVSYEDWVKLDQMRRDGTWSADGLKINLMDTLFETHFAFYQNAEKRDEIFYKNLAKIFKSSNFQLPTSNSAPKAAVMVAGGFHAHGLCSLLKKNGISYALVMPEIKTMPEQSNYRQHMQGNVSWKNYFEVKNGKVNLYNAFIRGTRDRLLGFSRESSVLSLEQKQLLKPNSQDPRLLKTWRDQIIRDLADEGRIEKAGEYTRFIDELTGEGHEQAVQKRLKQVDHFLEGLKRLDSEGQFNAANIAKLMPQATVPDSSGAVLVGGSRSEMRAFALGLAPFSDQAEAEVTTIDSGTPDTVTLDALDEVQTWGDGFVSDQAAEDYIAAHKPEFRDLARFLLQHITYIDEEQFGQALEAAVKNFLAKQGDKPFVIVTSKWPTNKQAVKSELFVYQQAMEKGLRQPEAIVEVENLASWLEDYAQTHRDAPAPSILILDDAAYSGFQLDNFLSKLLNNFSMTQGNDLDIHLIVPFTTALAEEKINSNRSSTYPVYFHTAQTIKTVGEIFEEAKQGVDERTLAQIQKLEEQAREAYESFDVTLAKLTFKAADGESTSPVLSGIVAPLHRSTDNIKQVTFLKGSNRWDTPYKNNDAFWTYLKNAGLVSPSAKSEVRSQKDESAASEALTPDAEWDRLLLEIMESGAEAFGDDWDKAGRRITNNLRYEDQPLVADRPETTLKTYMQRARKAGTYLYPWFRASWNDQGARGVQNRRLLASFLDEVVAALEDIPKEILGKYNHVLRLAVVKEPDSNALGYQKSKPGGVGTINFSAYEKTNATTKKRDFSELRSDISVTVVHELLLHQLALYATDGLHLSREDLTYLWGLAGITSVQLPGMPMWPIKDFFDLISENNIQQRIRSASFFDKEGKELFDYHGNPFEVIAHTAGQGSLEATYRHERTSGLGVHYGLVTDLLKVSLFRGGEALSPTLEGLQNFAYGYTFENGVWTPYLIKQNAAGKWEETSGLELEERLMDELEKIKREPSESLASKLEKLREIERLIEQEKENKILDKSVPNLESQVLLTHLLLLPEQSTKGTVNVEQVLERIRLAMERLPAESQERQTVLSTYEAAGQAVTLLNELVDLSSLQMVPVEEMLARLSGLVKRADTLKDTGYFGQAMASARRSVAAALTTRLSSLEAEAAGLEVPDPLNQGTFEGDKKTFILRRASLARAAEALSTFAAQNPGIVPQTISEAIRTFQQETESMQKRLFAGVEAKEFLGALKTRLDHAAAADADVSKRELAEKFQASLPTVRDIVVALIIQEMGLIQVDLEGEGDAVSRGAEGERQLNAWLNVLGDPTEAGENLLWRQAVETVQESILSNSTVANRYKRVQKENIQNALHYLEGLQAETMTPSRQVTRLARLETNPFLPELVAETLETFSQQGLAALDQAAAQGATVVMPAFLREVVGPFLQDSARVQFAPAATVQRGDFTQVIQTGSPVYLLIEKIEILPDGRVSLIGKNVAAGTTLKITKSPEATVNIAQPAGNVVFRSEVRIDAGDDGEKDELRPGIQVIEAMSLENARVLPEKQKVFIEGLKELRSSVSFQPNERYESFIRQSIDSRVSEYGGLSYKDSDVIDSELTDLVGGDLNEAIRWVQYLSDRVASQSFFYSEIKDFSEVEKSYRAEVFSANLWLGLYFATARFLKTKVSEEDEQELLRPVREAVLSRAHTILGGLNIGDLRAPERLAAMSLAAHLLFATGSYHEFFDSSKRRFSGLKSFFSRLVLKKELKKARFETLSQTLQFPNQLNRSFFAWIGGNLFILAALQFVYQSFPILFYQSLMHFGLFLSAVVGTFLAWNVPIYTYLGRQMAVLNGEHSGGYLAKNLYPILGGVAISLSHKSRVGYHEAVHRENRLAGSVNLKPLENLLDRALDEAYAQYREHSVLVKNLTDAQRKKIWKRSKDKVVHGYTKKFYEQSLRSEKIDLAEADAKVLIAKAIDVLAEADALGYGSQLGPFIAEFRLRPMGLPDFVSRFGLQPNQSNEAYRAYLSSQIEDVLRLRQERLSRVTSLQQTALPAGSTSPAAKSEVRNKKTEEAYKALDEIWGSLGTMMQVQADGNRETLLGKSWGQAALNFEEDSMPHRLNIILRLILDQFDDFYQDGESRDTPVPERLQTILKVIDDRIIPGIEQTHDSWAKALPSAGDWLSLQTTYLLGDTTMYWNRLNNLAQFSELYPESVLARLSMNGLHLRVRFSQFDQEDFIGLSPIFAFAIRVIQGKETFQDKQTAAIAMVNALRTIAPSSHVAEFINEYIKPFLVQNLSQSYGISEEDFKEAVSEALRMLEDQDVSVLDLSYGDDEGHDFGVDNIGMIVKHNNDHNARPLSVQDVFLGRPNALSHLKSNHLTDKMRRPVNLIFSKILAYVGYEPTGNLLGLGVSNAKSEVRRQEGKPSIGARATGIGAFFAGLGVSAQNAIAQIYTQLTITPNVTQEDIFWGAISKSGIVFFSLLALWAVLVLARSLFGKWMSISWLDIGGNTAAKSAEKSGKERGLLRFTRFNLSSVLIFLTIASIALGVGRQEYNHENEKYSKHLAAAAKTGMILFYPPAEQEEALKMAVRDKNNEVSAIIERIVNGEETLGERDKTAYWLLNENLTFEHLEQLLPAIEKLAGDVKSGKSQSELFIDLTGLLETKLLEKQLTQEDEPKLTLIREVYAEIVKQHLESETEQSSYVVFYAAKILALIFADPNDPVTIPIFESLMNPDHPSSRGTSGLVAGFMQNSYRAQNPGVADKAGLLWSLVKPGMTTEETEIRGGLVFTTIYPMDRVGFLTREERESLEHLLRVLKDVGSPEVQEVAAAALSVNKRSEMRNDTGRDQRINSQQEVLRGHLESTRVESPFFFERSTVSPQTSWERLFQFENRISSLDVAGLVGLPILGQLLHDQRSEPPEIAALRDKILDNAKRVEKDDTKKLHPGVRGRAHKDQIGVRNLEDDYLWQAFEGIPEVSEMLGNPGTLMRFRAVLRTQLLMDDLSIDSAYSNGLKQVGMLLALQLARDQGAQSAESLAVLIHQRLEALAELEARDAPYFFSIGTEVEVKKSKAGSGFSQPAAHVLFYHVLGGALGNDALIEYAMEPAHSPSVVRESLKLMKSLGFIRDGDYPHSMHASFILPKAMQQLKGVKKLVGRLAFATAVRYVNVKRIKSFFKGYGNPIWDKYGVDAVTTAKQGKSKPDVGIFGKTELEARTAMDDIRLEQRVLESASTESLDFLYYFHGLMYHTVRVASKLNSGSAISQFEYEAVRIFNVFNAVLSKLASDSQIPTVRAVLADDVDWFGWDARQIGANLLKVKQTNDANYGSARQEIEKAVEMALAEIEALMKKVAIAADDESVLHELNRAIGAGQRQRLKNHEAVGELQAEIGRDSSVENEVEQFGSQNSDYRFDFGSSSGHERYYEIPPKPDYTAIPFPRGGERFAFMEKNLSAQPEFIKFLPKLLLLNPRAFERNLWNALWFFFVGVANNLPFDVGRWIVRVVSPVEERAYAVYKSVTTFIKERGDVKKRKAAETAVDFWAPPGKFLEDLIAEGSHSESDGSDDFLKWNRAEISHIEIFDSGKTRWHSVDKKAWPYTVVTPPGVQDSKDWSPYRVYFVRSEMRNVTWRDVLWAGVSAVIATGLLVALGLNSRREDQRPQALPQTNPEGRGFDDLTKSEPAKAEAVLQAVGEILERSRKQGNEALVDLFGTEKWKQYFRVLPNEAALQHGHHHEAEHDEQGASGKASSELIGVHEGSLEWALGDKVAGFPLFVRTLAHEAIHWTHLSGAVVIRHDRANPDAEETVTREETAFLFEEIPHYWTDENQSTIVYGIFFPRDEQGRFMFENGQPQFFVNAYDSEKIPEDEVNAAVIKEIEALLNNPEKKAAIHGYDQSRLGAEKERLRKASSGKSADFDAAAKRSEVRMGALPPEVYQQIATEASRLLLLVDRESSMPLNGRSGAKGKQDILDALRRVETLSRSQGNIEEIVDSARKAGAWYPGAVKKNMLLLDTIGLKRQLAVFSRFVHAQKRKWGNAARSEMRSIVLDAEESVQNSSAVVNARFNDAVPAKELDRRSEVRTDVAVIGEILGGDLGLRVAEILVNRIDAAFVPGSDLNQALIEGSISLSFEGGAGVIRDLLQDRMLRLSQQDSAEPKDIPALVNQLKLQSDQSPQEAALLFILESTFSTQMHDGRTQGLDNGTAVFLSNLQIYVEGIKENFFDLLGISNGLRAADPLVQQDALELCPYSAGILFYLSQAFTEGAVRIVMADVAIPGQSFGGAAHLWAEIIRPDGSGFYISLVDSQFVSFGYDESLSHQLTGKTNVFYFKDEANRTAILKDQKVTLSSHLTIIRERGRPIRSGHVIVEHFEALARLHRALAVIIQAKTTGDESAMNAEVPSIVKYYRWVSLVKAAVRFSRSSVQDDRISKAFGLLKTAADVYETGLGEFVARYDDLHVVLWQIAATQSRLELSDLGDLLVTADDVERDVFRKLGRSHVVPPAKIQGALDLLRQIEDGVIEKTFERMERAEVLVRELVAEPDNAEKQQAVRDFIDRYPQLITLVYYNLTTTADLDVVNVIMQFLGRSEVRQQAGMAAGELVTDNLEAELKAALAPSVATLAEFVEYGKMSPQEFWENVAKKLEQMSDSRMKVDEVTAFLSREVRAFVDSKGMEKAISKEVAEEFNALVLEVFKPSDESLQGGTYGVSFTGQENLSELAAAARAIAQQLANNENTLLIKIQDRETRKHFTEALDRQGIAGIHRIPISGNQLDASLYLGGTQLKLPMIYGAVGEQFGEGTAGIGISRDLETKEVVLPADLAVMQLSRTLLQFAAARYIAFAAPGESFNVRLKAALINQMGLAELKDQLPDIFLTDGQNNLAVSEDAVFIMLNMVTKMRAQQAVKSAA